MTPLTAAGLFVAILVLSLLWDITPVGLTLRTIAFGLMLGVFARSGVARLRGVRG